jgi:hypothetical protein
MQSIFIAASSCVRIPSLTRSPAIALSEPDADNMAGSGLTA